MRAWRSVAHREFRFFRHRCGCAVELAEWYPGWTVHWLITASRRVRATKGGRQRNGDLFHDRQVPAWPLPGRPMGQGVEDCLRKPVPSPAVLLFRRVADCSVRGQQVKGVEGVELLRSRREHDLQVRVYVYLQVHRWSR